MKISPNIRKTLGFPLALLLILAGISISCLDYNDGGLVAMIGPVTMLGNSLWVRKPLKPLMPRWALIDSMFGLIVLHTVVERFGTQVMPSHPLAFLRIPFLRHLLVALAGWSLWITLIVRRWRALQRDGADAARQYEA